MIRRMEKTDLEGVKTLAKEFFVISSQDTVYTWNEGGFQKLFDMATDDKGIFTGVVAEDKGDIIGVLVFGVIPTMAFNQSNGHEIMWYVKPSARGSVGIKMFKTAEEIAKLMGAHAMIFVANRVSGFDKVCDFYKRSGYRMIEQLYYKGL